MADETTKYLARVTGSKTIYSTAKNIPLTSKPIRDIVENCTWVSKAKLFGNFKGLNEGVGHSVDFKITTNDVIEGVKDRIFQRDKDLEENMRKKFLQEKIELFFKLIREIKEFN